MRIVIRKGVVEILYPCVLLGKEKKPHSQVLSLALCMFLYVPFAFIHTVAGLLAYQHIISVVKVNVS